MSEMESSAQVRENSRNTIDSLRSELEAVKRERDGLKIKIAATESMAQTGWRERAEAAEKNVKHWHQLSMDVKTERDKWIAGFKNMSEKLQDKSQWAKTMRQSYENEVESLKAQIERMTDREKRFREAVVELEISSEKVIQNAHQFRLKDDDLRKAISDHDDLVLRLKTGRIPTAANSIGQHGQLKMDTPAAPVEKTKEGV